MHSSQLSLSPPVSHPLRVSLASLCLQTVLQLVTMICSVAFYLIFSLIYNAACLLCNPPTNPYWIMERQLKDPIFYLLCLITPAMALLPRFECSPLFLLWVCRHGSAETMVMWTDLWCVRHVLYRDNWSEWKSDGWVQPSSSWTIHLFT